MISKEELSKLCVKCQACCKEVAIHSQYPYTQAVAEFYEARGFRVYNESGMAVIHLDYPCPKLTPLGCSIYETRPEVCKEFDGRLHFAGGEGKCLWPTTEGEVNV